MGRRCPRRRVFNREECYDSPGIFDRRSPIPTQRECLELLGCYGKDKVRKLTEILAATVLCGELSLGSAVGAEEWVEAHDLFGRNRP